MTKTALSPKAWIEAGLSRLEHEGPTALRAEPLARHLRTTKGSFYWHFKDVPAFQTAVLERWAEDTTASQHTDSKAGGTPTDQMIRFAQLILSDRIGIAIRAWGQSDLHASLATAGVDEARTQRLRAILALLDVQSDDFTQAAYASLIGLQQLNLDEGDALVAFASLIDIKLVNL